MVKITGDYQEPDKSNVHPRDAARKYIIQDSSDEKKSSTQQRCEDLAALRGLKPASSAQALPAQGLDAARKYIDKPSQKGDAARKYIDKAAHVEHKIDSGLALAFAMLAVLGITALGISASYQSQSDNGDSGYLQASESAEKSGSEEPSGWNARQKIEEFSKTNDPAVELKEGEYVYAMPNEETPWLNSIDEYKRGAGDMARVQERLLRDRSVARRYPGVNVGYVHVDYDDCQMDHGTLGSYHLRCEEILVNFKGQGMTYERPIDVLTVMAHEWGHHLTNISWDLDSVSNLEQEMIADCFAGVMHGYWAKHSKLSEREFERAGELMIAISKRAEDIDDEHGDPGQRMGAFLGGALMATGKDSRQYRNFCAAMDELFDWERGLP